MMSLLESEHSQLSQHSNHEKIEQIGKSIAELSQLRSTRGQLHLQRLQEERSRNKEEWETQRTNAVDQFNALEKTLLAQDREALLRQLASTQAQDDIHAKITHAEDDFARHALEVQARTQDYADRITDCRVRMAEVEAISKEAVTARESDYEAKLRNCSREIDRFGTASLPGKDKIVNEFKKLRGFLTEEKELRSEWRSGMRGRLRETRGAL